MKKIFFIVILSLIVSLFCGYGDFFQYKRAERANTVEALTNYINKYPNGQYVDGALIKIEILKFAQACKKNTFSSYDTYINEYPNGLFVDSADFCKELLFQDEVLAYIGYTEDKTEIKKMCDKDLKGMCLSRYISASMDVGTIYLDMYCNERIAVSGRAGKNIFLLYVEDNVKIEYNDGRIEYFVNDSPKKLREKKSLARDLKNSGMTFKREWDIGTVSRTIAGGAINIY